MPLRVPHPERFSRRVGSLRSHLLTTFAFVVSPLESHIFVVACDSQLSTLDYQLSTINYVPPSSLLCISHA